MLMHIFVIVLLPNAWTNFDRCVIKHIQMIFCAKRKDLPHNVKDHVIEDTLQYTVHNGYHY